MTKYPDINISTKPNGLKTAMQKEAKLKKYNIAIAKLWDIILNLTEEQQQTLLRQIDAQLERDKREFVRKSCDLQVDFATADRTHKGRIKNISQLGVFIEAKAPVIIGEKILMIFSLNRETKAVKLRGEVVHATRWGIGVEFTAKEPRFDRQLKDLLRQLR